MAQFDVHRNIGSTRLGAPYLLVVQSSLFDAGHRRVVVPLVPIELLRDRDPRLSPAFAIEGRMHVLATHGITNVPRDRLGPAVVNLRAESEQIIAAIDWLINRGWN